VIFLETDLSGSFIIEAEKIEDKRGFFARTFCKNEFQSHGLDTPVVQCNISVNIKKGTLRGMHYQTAPHGETKLVRCTRGAIFDVIIDIRPNSQCFKKWISVELSAENRKMLYVPKGFAHGFQTLTDDTEVFYQMSDFYQPACARGARYNDPAFNITWPEAVRVISETDRTHPDFKA